jgi:SAM-dependent methyltransferase
MLPEDLPLSPVAHYAGLELELFARAHRWKAYLADLLRPHLTGDVLEVGAGLGATTAALCDGRQRRWVCLEPDPDMAKGLERAIGEGRLPGCCRVVAGTLTDLLAADRFDAIAYVDVLEHIRDDAAELARAAGHLVPGGRLVVVAPAHSWLYSPFDAAIGHHRRYTTGSLSGVVPAGLTRVTVRYLDAVGLLASAANRVLLRQRLPDRRQLALWDGWMVPLSRAVDPLLGFRVGKSILGVWRTDGGDRR